MLNIDNTLKTIYKNDGVPASSETAHKVLILYFPDLDLTITNDRIVSESFSLTESICSADDLEFGSCEASMVKITVANLEQDLSGYKFVVTQTINDTYTIPLGTYKVESCKKQNDWWFREIIAYDCMKNADTDVAGWYNSMFPTGTEVYTLKQFRESLLDYLNIPYEDETLPNDNMLITKTIDATQLSGREVLRQCVELQGAFGQINRHGKFTHKILAETYTDYPQEDYPQEDYPQEEPYEQIYGSMVAQNGIKFEEYTCKPIDKLIIRQEEGDVGCIYGGGTNAYIVQGNFLLYGKSSEELEAIAANIAQNIFNREYRPFTGDLIGLPYLEVGDGVKFNINDTVVSYVLQRTLTGIQALRDEISTPGSEEREQNFGVNTEIIQLKGKTTRIKKDVEGIRVEVENLEESTSTRFEQTDTAISAEATRAVNAETVLNGKIEVNAESISQEVSRAAGAESLLNTKITQTAESITQEISAKYTTKDEVIGLLPSETLYPSPTLYPKRSVTSDLTADYNSKFQQTATDIALEVNRATQAEGELIGSVSVLAGQVELKVDASGVISAINLSSEGIKIAASNISLEGIVTVNGNFKVLLDGSIEAVNGKFSGNITASSFVGGYLQSTNYVAGTSGMMIDLTNCIIDTPNLYVDSAGKIHATDGEFSGDITGSAITGSTFSRVVNWSGTQVTLTTIDDNGFYQWISDTSGARFQVGSLNHYNSILADQNGVTIGNAYNGHSVVVGQYGVFIDNQTPITTGNISSQNVYSLGGAVYVSANGNFRPFNSGGSSCGTADGKWSSVWAVNGTIQTSDEREKTDILLLEEDERFLRFAKMIAPYTFKMVSGTSGRKHIGFIAQRIEEAMVDCGISSMEFAGLIKAPVYAEKLKDVNGNELNEYDTTSEIIDYTYHLRYEEFIPLIFLWLRSL
jgi:hypothetical protein